MQIVIDIPENRYEYMISHHELPYGLSNVLRKGKPLPKGHGRLVDADSLIKAIEEKAKRLSNADTINGLCGAVALIFDEPTIIERDKESD